VDSNPDARENRDKTTPDNVPDRPTVADGVAVRTLKVEQADRRQGEQFSGVSRDVGDEVGREMHDDRRGGQNTGLLSYGTHSVHMSYSVQYAPNLEACLP